MRCGVRILLGVAVLGLTMAPARAQDGPPVPPQPAPLDLPAVQEATLSSGARLIFLPDPGPRLHLEVVLPGGSAGDPPTAPGTAALLTQLLGEGTTSRASQVLRQELDRLGAVVSARAAPDHISVGLRVGAEHAAEALQLLGEILREPALPEESLTQVRAGLAQALEEARASDGRVAAEVFSARLYGDHPYGRVLSAEAVRDVTREDLLDYHARVVRPGGARIIAAGPLGLAELQGLLESGFQGWEGEGIPLPEVSDAANGAATEIVIAHRPDVTRALVVGGVLLPETDEAGWAALRVASRILGAGPGSRLTRTLRDERAYTPSAESSVARRRGGGLFQVGMTVRPQVAGAALAELLNEIVVLRDRPVTPDELSRAREGELGSLYLGLETVESRLDQVTADLLQGRSPTAVEALAREIQGVNPSGLQRVFRASVDPQEMLFVVVGNAEVLRDQLSPMGVVTVIDGGAGVVALNAAEEQTASHDFTGEGLEPVRLGYSIYAGDEVVGEITRTLDTIPGGLLRFTSEAELGGQVVEQSVTVRREGLRFVEASTDLRMGSRNQSGRVRREGDRIVGVQDTPAGPIEVDIPAGPDVLVSDMVELILWASDLSPGMEIRVPVANLRSGLVQSVTLSVGASRLLDLPWGSVQAYPVVLSGDESQTFWARVSPPHISVVIAPENPPLEIVLTDLEAPGEDPPGAGSPGGL